MKEFKLPTIQEIYEAKYKSQRMLQRISVWLIVIFLVLFMLTYIIGPVTWMRH